MPERAANLRAELILKAMIAVGSADGGLEDREVSLIQQVYEDQAERPITPEEIAEVSQASTRDGLLAELSAASPVLDRETKEEIIRAAYLTLLADGRIAAEERKKLKDIAMALRVPEIHFGAILEDLALWLEEQKSKRSDRLQANFGSWKLRLARLSRLGDKKQALNFAMIGRTFGDDAHVAQAAAFEEIPDEDLVPLAQLRQEFGPRAFLCRADLEDQDLVHARHERGYEFPRGREAIGADDVVDDRHADHGIEFRQGKKVFRADERPDRRHALGPIVEPRQFTHSHAVRCLDANGEAMQIGSGATNEPAFRAANVEHVAHAKLLEHSGDRAPAPIAVSDVVEAPAADFDRLVGPAACLRHVERRLDQAERQAPSRTPPHGPEAPANGAPLRSRRIGFEGPDFR